ncbi:T9SS type A sorting domain-containing protein [Aureisphaera sp.]
MKKLFLSILTLIAALQAQAQDPDPRIFKTWYITEYVEENISYFPLEGYPIEIFEEGSGSCAYNFYLPNPWVLSDACIGSITNTYFTIQYLGVLDTPSLCLDGPAECYDFFELYYPFYENAHITGDPLSYVIQDNPDNTQSLVVTNLQGDQAIYNNTYLSLNEFSISNTIIFPNPVNNFLNLESQYNIEKVNIFSLQGQLLKQSFNTRIDVSGLSPGLYLINLFVNGQIITKKFVKS